MLISVLMPSLNSGRYIEAAVKSVLGQPDAELELVVQDAGSTDETLPVLAGICDSRLRVITEPDSGQADALNRALARARGDWIMWLNATDILMPGALAAVSPHLNRSTDFVYGDSQILEQDGRAIRTWRPSARLSVGRLLALGCYPFSGTWAVRRDVFTRFGGFDERLHFTMDYEFILRLAGQVSAVHCGHVVAGFRVHEDAKTSGGFLAQLKEQASVCRRFTRDRPWSLILAAYGLGRAATYYSLIPVWQSHLWRTLRGHRAAQGYAGAAALRAER